MNRVVYIVLFFWSAFAFGQTQNVLFIGNSFTMNYEMPKRFSQIAKNEGKSLYVKQITKGGMDWQYHATNPNTYETLKSEPWDYVILQAKSFEPLFDSITVEKTTKRYGKQMIDSVRQYWPNVKIMLFMTWGYKNGIDLDNDRGHLNYEEMQQRLKNQYLSFADEFKVAVAPVGEIWKQVKDEYPSVNLYETDSYHQNKVGSFLVASTFYNMIFESPLEQFNNIPYQIDEQTTRNIAEKTRDIVLNPKYDWKTKYWFASNEDNFTYFDYSFKKDSLILKANVPDDYIVKWKLDGKTISNQEKVAISLNKEEDFELQLIFREGVLRGRKTEEAIYEGGKKLTPID